MCLLNVNIYSEFVKKNIARILTQADRDKNSRTYGSCDRNYWHLKIRDFSSAILQQTCLTMALLYNVNFEGNVYYKNVNLKEWSIAALHFVGNIQLKDGSFNEYYPNEHGFPPTAFVLFAACKTYIELELNDTLILRSLEKTADWLMKHSEINAYNQEWAAIAGLQLYYKISEKQEVLDGVKRKVENILKVQSEEGWFPEQGGADIGYSSVALDMMTEYYWISKDSSIVEPMDKLVNFLSHFVHPDGTIGGEYGSRNTIYFMPNGLEAYIALGLDKNNVAKSMVQMIYEVSRQGVFGDFMDAVDERYLTHYVLHSYLRAIQKYKLREKVCVTLPFNTAHVKVFEKAGLITFYNGNYFSVISTQKGGIVKVYKGNEEVFWDCGYRIPIKAGSTAATNWLDSSYKIDYKDKEYWIQGKFNLVTPKVQNPIYHLGLRVSAFLLGDKVNHLIKKITIFQDKHYDADFERRVILKDNSILIEDKIHNPQKKDIVEAPNISLRLVASGKFFSRSDLLRTDLKDYGNAKEVSIKRFFDVEKKQLIYN